MEQSFKHLRVNFATSSFDILFLHLLPAKIIFGFNIIPFKSTLCKINFSKHLLSLQKSFMTLLAECSPSIKTSGSTIGTILHSWTNAEYLAKACALDCIESLLG